MNIDHIKEYQLMQRLLRKLPVVDPWSTAVLNIAPEYSSMISMQVAHHLSHGRRILDIFSVEVPHPGESSHRYEVIFKEMNDALPILYDKVILCQSLVLTGRNFKWVKEVLLDLGYENDDIITVSLFQHDDSLFECDYIGEYCSEMPKFYWQRHNK